MKLRIARDLDVEVTSKFPADEADQFIGILEWAWPRHAIRPVAAQDNQALNASFAIGRQDAVQHVLALRHAGNMRRHGDIRVCSKGFNGVPGCLQGGTTRPESNGQVVRFKWREFLPGRFQYQFLFRRPWRKELE